MQCPKCKKEYSLDTSYCDDCSAMLEPAERAQEQPPLEIEEPSQTPVSAAVASEEQIEDIRIDSLKTDIEESFIATLLYELTRLRERMERKESALSDLQNRQTDTNTPDLVLKIGSAETELSDILRRTAKIESLLENLKKKLEADIAALNMQIGQGKEPGLFGFLSASGRYASMLSSDLKVKKSLLTAVETRKYTKRKGMLNYAFVIGAILIITGLLAFPLLRSSQKTSQIPSSADRKTVSAPAIQAKDIYDLLEDIKKANMNKDLSLWKSRYSRHYLEAGGKKSEAEENWKKFDFISLHYKVQDIQMLPEKITAIILWDIELRSMESGRVTRTTQRLLSEFVVEDRTLKIASVRKIGQ